jgi:RHS repeat-associated protein
MALKYSLAQSYDGNGVRVKKVENGATTLYLRSSVLGGQVVTEMNGAGSWTRRYVYLGSQLLAVQNAGVYWMHEDPVTKSKRVTNSAGAVVSTIETDPWGADTARSSNAPFQPRKFTSYDRDQNGTDEAMFRRYNRWQSRFDQPDPYDGSYNFTNPQSFNRYAYVQNDPVNFVDPSGLNLEEPDHRWSATDGINPMGFMGPGIHLETNSEGDIIQRWIVFGPFGPQDSLTALSRNEVSSLVGDIRKLFKDNPGCEEWTNKLLSEMKASTGFDAGTIGQILENFAQTGTIYSNGRVNGTGSGSAGTGIGGRSAVSLTYGTTTAHTATTLMHEIIHWAGMPAQWVSYGNYYTDASMEAAWNKLGVTMSVADYRSTYPDVVGADTKRDGYDYAESRLAGAANRITCLGERNGVRKLP